jgi:iron complex outermembrane recepter protein
MKVNKTRAFSKANKLCLFLSIGLYCFPSWAKSAVILPDANVKASTSSRNNMNDAISTTHFTKADINKSPVIDLSQLFKQEQSVVRLTNTSGDASQTALSLRGFGDNAAANSLILIDGFPLTNPSLLAPNFNSIPLSDIERIDILQGSEGSLWGDQAVGGVVNIVTKHPRKFFVNAILSAGSYNTFYDNVLMGDKADNGLFYKVFGLVGKTNNYRRHNQQQGNNLAVQVGRDYARGTLSVNAQSYADTTYFPGSLSEEEFNQHPRQANEFHNYSRYRTTLFQLLNKQEISAKWILETRVNHHSTEGNGFVFLRFDRNDSLTSFNPRLIGHINNNKMTLGYDGQLSDYELTNIKVQSKTSARQHDLYVQTVLPLISRFDFVLGARKAWQTNKIQEVIGQPVNALNQVFVTEQGIVYHASETLSFFVRRDGNFSFPKANEQTWLPDNVTFLQVQTGTSYETGSEWTSDKHTTKISLYRLALNNEIAFNPRQTMNQPFGAFTNLDQTLRHGISLAERYRLTSRASIDGQINYVNARFASGLFNGKRIPAVPAINGNAGFHYDWTDHWKTQYFLLYTGNRYPSEDVENASKKLPGYWLHDVALQYVMKSWIVSAEINNLLNKNYAAYAFYDAFTQTTSYYPAAGRNYSLTLKISID